ncbi:unnamed protein product [Vitrella brassicaformis CCMP3155]|uniref:Protein kinase domain-containing protein n=1 Tax=Vitrella brassicaformis (strain CCMP3155) TaxID=1169540 RepID=A0A0G4EQN2_VITBC|nr:unnamed protein product [Vitrella brassicaformis CCMP3155]|eukprot:CEL99745.1 unnamed protein product [Vitrella brassicaformis CCMP3155]
MALQDLYAQGLVAPDPKAPPEVRRHAWDAHDADEAPLWRDQTSADISRSLPRVHQLIHWAAQDLYGAGKPQLSCFDKFVEQHWLAQLAREVWCKLPTAWQRGSFFCGLLRRLSELASMKRAASAEIAALGVPLVADGGGRGRRFLHTATISDGDPHQEVLMEGMRARGERECAVMFSVHETIDTHTGARAMAQAPSTSYTAERDKLSDAPDWCWDDGGWEVQKLHAVLHEARVMGRIRRAGRHPHICRIKAAQFELGAAAIYVEKAEGLQLSEFLSSKGYQPPSQLEHHEGLRVARQMLEALAFLHSECIIHRDVKPANIIYDRRKGRKGSSLKLIDFG